MQQDRVFSNIKESLDNVKKYMDAGNIQMAESCQGTADTLINIVTVLRCMTRDEVLNKVASM